MSIQEHIAAAQGRGVTIEFTSLTPGWHECRVGDKVRSFTEAALLRGDFEHWIDQFVPTEEEDVTEEAEPEGDGRFGEERPERTGDDHLGAG